MLPTTNFTLNNLPSTLYSQTKEATMGAQSVFFFISIKAIFCLALVATLTNLVLTQNLYTSMLDDTRNALMSFSSGSSSSTPTPAPATPAPRPPISSRRRRSVGWGSFGSKFYHSNLLDLFCRGHRSRPRKVLVIAYLFLYRRASVIRLHYSQSEFKCNIMISIQIFVVEQVLLFGHDFAPTGVLGPA